VKAVITASPIMSKLQAVDTYIRNAYKILVGKPERKGSRGRPRHRIILEWILGK